MASFTAYLIESQKTEQRKQLLADLSGLFATVATVANEVADPTLARALKEAALTGKLKTGQLKNSY